MHGSETGVATDANRESAESESHVEFSMPRIKPTTSTPTRATSPAAALLKVTSTLGRWIDESGYTNKTIADLGCLDPKLIRSLRNKSATSVDPFTVLTLGSILLREPNEISATYKALST